MLLAVILIALATILIGLGRAPRDTRMYRVNTVKLQQHESPVEGSDTYDLHNF